MPAAFAAFVQLRERLGQSVIGQPAVIEALLIALLADGHVLLEAMEERQVAVAGQTHALPQPFLVMPRQIPIDHA